MDNQRGRSRGTRGARGRGASRGGYEGDWDDGRGRGRGRGNSGHGTTGFVARGGDNINRSRSTPNASYRGSTGGEARGASFQQRGAFRGSPRGRGPSGGHSPYGPQRVFQEEIPALPDPRVDDASMHALVSSFADLRMSQPGTAPPLRLDWGTIGEKIALRTNFFPLKLPKDILIYDYNVKIRQINSEIAKGRGKGRGKGKTQYDDASNGKLDGLRKARIFELLERSSECAPHMDHVAHDRSSRLVSARILPQPLAVTIAYAEDDTSASAIEYTVEIVLARTLDPKGITAPHVSHLLHSYLEGRDRDYDILPLVSALNLVLQKRALQAGAVPVGQNKYFFLSEERFDLFDRGDSGFLQARRGFFMSIRPAFKTLMLNINTSFAAFYDNRYTGNLADVMVRLSNELRQVPHSFFPGLKVEPSHLKYRKVYTVRKLGDGSARRTKFSFRGKLTTVEEYFRITYNIELHYADNLPVIDVGKRNEPVWLPAEVCTIRPNQPYRNQLDPKATAKMIAFACNPPAVNADLITGHGLPLFGFSASQGQVNNNATLNNFGLSVSAQMAVSPARILPPPIVEYKAAGAGSARAIVTKGGWNMDKNARFQKGANMGSWAVLLIQEGKPGVEFSGPEDGNLKSFLEELKNKCRSRGMQVPIHDPRILTVQLPAVRKAQYQQVDTIRAALMANLNLTDKARKPSFILVLVSSQHIYPEVKQLCDVELGVHSVIMDLNKARYLHVDDIRRRENNQRGYFGNVALKINMKLQGVNHSLNKEAMAWMGGARTMLVGIDVTHPSPTSQKGAPSIAAVVANADGNFAQYPASLALQKNKRIDKDSEEMVQDLEKMMVERLALYQKNTNTLPERIFVFRDGVSEGQIKLVLQHELPQLKAAFTHFKFISSPKLSLFICTKRHHSRAFATDREHMTQNGNTLPGTVIDQGITDIYYFDFYLQPHDGLKGTVRMTRYGLIHDENGLTADQAQTGVHNTSYMYARATKAVSLVPPAYYADIVCERARMYLGAVMNDPDAHSASSSARQGKGKARESEADRRLEVFEEAKRRWGQGVHEDLKDTMFYI